MTPLKNNNTSEAQTKICKLCRIVKQLTEFYIFKRSKDGRHARCIECSKMMARLNYYNNRESILKKLKDRMAKRMVDAPDEERSRRSEYYINNRASILKKRKIYQANNPEKIKRKNKEFFKKNPEKYREASSRRRAKIAGAPINDLTSAQWIEIQEKYDHRCAYCGKKFKGKLAQEHITPISNGGSHTLSNIVPACQSCNSKKRTGPPLVPVQPLLLTFTE